MQQHAAIYLAAGGGGLHMMHACGYLCSKCTAEYTHANSIMSICNIYMPACLPACHLSCMSNKLIFLIHASSYVWGYQLSYYSREGSSYIIMCSQAVTVCSFSPSIYAQGECFLMRRNCNCNCNCNCIQHVRSCLHMLVPARQQQSTYVVGQ
jgi:hypothetical protein